MQVETQINAAMDSTADKTIGTSRFSRLWSGHFLAAYVILAVALSAHGLWLINDVIVHEDWMWYDWAKEKRLDYMWNNASSSNSHAGFFPFALLALYPNIVLGARLTTFALVWSAALLVYLIAVRHTPLGRRESLMIAVVSLIYPGNMVAHLFGLISYPFYLTVFLAASLLALEAETCSGTKHRILRSLAALLFCMSFVVGSLLVFYAGFIVIHFLRFRSAPEVNTVGTGPINQIASYVRQRIDYLLWPGLYWVIKTTCASVFNGIDYNTNMVSQFCGSISSPFYMLVFLLAIYLVLEAETCAGTKHWAWRILAGILFAVSFSMMAARFLYAGFLVAQLLRFRSQQQGGPGTFLGNSRLASWRQSIFGFLTHGFDYFLWPVLYCLTKLIYGSLLNDLEPEFDLLEGLRQQVSQTDYHDRSMPHTLKILTTFLETIGIQLLLLTRPSALTTGGAVGLGFAAVWFCWCKFQKYACVRIRSGSATLVFGSFLLFCAIFPYVAVGKSPSLNVEDTATRCNLLIGIPMAVLLVGTFGVLTRNLRMGPVLQVLFVGALVGAGSRVWIAHCTKYQAYGVRYWTVRTALRGCPEAQAAHFWQFSSQLPGFGDNVMPDYCVPFYLRDVFQGRLDRYLDGHNDIAQPSELADYQMPPESASHGTIIIEPGETDTSASHLVFAYWYYKYLDQKHLTDFLEPRPKSQLPSMPQPPSIIDLSAKAIEHESRALT